MIFISFEIFEALNMISVELILPLFDTDCMSTLFNDNETILPADL